MLDAFRYALWSILAVTATVCWADEFSDVKLLHALPLTEAEVAAAFTAARQDACEQIGEDQPLELSSFTTNLTRRDLQLGSRRQLAATRRGFLSIGLTIEETGLPILSKSLILDYVDKNFVVLQARIRKDLLDRKLYYHHRPIAVTGQYSGAKLTRPFEPVVTQTLNSIRSLGVISPPNARPLKAEHLRLLVLVFRFEQTGSFGTKRESFELALVRGREDSTGSNLEPHVFVTAENRSKLLYLRDFDYPQVRSSAAIVGQVKIIEFDKTTGLYPTKSVTTSYTVAGRAEYELQRLEEYCRQNYDGTMSTTIVQLLDDLIDQKIEFKQP